NGALFPPNGGPGISTFPFLFVRAGRFLKHLADQVAWAQDGAVFRMATVPGGDPVLVDGPPVWSHYRYEDVVAVRDGFVALISQPARVRKISYVGEELAVSATTAIAGFDDHDYVTHAALDSLSGALIAGGYVVTSTSPPLLTPFLRRVEGDGASSSEIALPI